MNKKTPSFSFFKLINNYKSLFLIPLIVLFFIGCTHGHCKNENSKFQTNKKIWIFKYDNSKQCQSKSGIALIVFEKELIESKIKIYQSKSEYDGLVRVQACGAYTGKAHLFQIKNKDLSLARTKGFQLWDF